LRRLLRAAQDGQRAAFTIQKGRAGFPFVLNLESRPVIEKQIGARDFSLQSLAKKLRARRLIVPARSDELLNVNTPEDAVRARKLTDT
jgi:CTP:molybdopterin cytidylyltransferase MocA